MNDNEINEARDSTTPEGPERAEAGAENGTGNPLIQAMATHVAQAAGSMAGVMAAAMAAPLMVAAANAQAVEGGPEASITGGAEEAQGDEQHEQHEEHEEDEEDEEDEGGLRVGDEEGQGLVPPVEGDAPAYLPTDGIAGAP